MHELELHIVLRMARSMQIADQQDNNKSETAVKPSRASPLPQGTAIQCGSGLAREEARKANKSAWLNTAAIHWCAKV
ncbi:hypothetical protein AL066_22220 [Pseudomonas nunensis]|nr:hypothetical protein AL066_22220 [Pseudomonas nunensis]